MSMDIDAAAPVRTGEELDEGALERFLRRELGGDGPLGVEQFPGGHSNLTYAVRWGQNDYVLRRPPFGAVARSAHDMSRELRVLSALSAVWDRAPEPVAACDDDSVLGAPFYLMKRLRGVILRARLPRGTSVDPGVARGLCETFVDTLAQLHDLDYEEIGLADFGRPAGYAERQVRGWIERYHEAKTHDIPTIDEVASWLALHLPADDDALVHNDYKLDNLVLDPDDLTRVVGILDWEMATIGHPLLDLGTALCYWVQADDPEPLRALPFGPTSLPGMMTRAELVERYQRTSGRAVPDAAGLYAFGLFKTAVVAQQIYSRFARGFTDDPRFEQMLTGVRVLGEAAARTIERGTV